MLGMSKPSPKKPRWQRPVPQGQPQPAGTQLLHGANRTKPHPPNSQPPQVATLLVIFGHTPVQDGPKPAFKSDQRSTILSKSCNVVLVPLLPAVKALGRPPCRDLAVAGKLGSKTLLASVHGRAQRERDAVKRTKIHLIRIPTITRNMLAHADTSRPTGPSPRMSNGALAMSCANHAEATKSPTPLPDSLASLCWSRDLSPEGDRRPGRKYGIQVKFAAEHGAIQPGRRRAQPSDRPNPLDGQ